MYRVGQKKMHWTLTPDISKTTFLNFIKLYKVKDMDVVCYGPTFKFRWSMGLPFPPWWNAALNLLKETATQTISLFVNWYASLCSHLIGMSFFLLPYTYHSGDFEQSQQWSLSLWKPFCQCLLWNIYSPYFLLLLYFLVLSRNSYPVIRFQFELVLFLSISELKCRIPQV